MTTEELKAEIEKGNEVIMNLMDEIQELKNQLFDEIEALQENLTKFLEEYNDAD